MISDQCKYVETVYEDDTKVVFRLSDAVSYTCMVMGKTCVFNDIHYLHDNVKSSVSIYDLIVDTGLIQHHERLSELEMTVISLSKKVILMVYDEGDYSDSDNKPTLIGLGLGINKMLYPMNDISISKIYNPTELTDILITGLI